MNLNQKDFDDLVDDSKRCKELQKICEEQEQRIIEKNRQLNELIPIVELLREIDIELTVQQIAEWAFLQGQDMDIEKRRSMGVTKDNLLKIKHFLENNK